MAQKDGPPQQPQRGPAPARKRTGDDLYSAFDNEVGELRVKQDTDLEGEVPGPSADEEAPTASAWKSKVLVTYKGKSPRDTSTLLARIPEGKATFRVGDRHKAVSIQEAMVQVVERMFDAFQNYGYDFNQEASGTELELNWIRPVFTKEPNGGNVFAGRLSTRLWTMVIKGTPQDVQAYILPADKMIGFSLSSTAFKPYFAMWPLSDGLDVKWRVEKTVLTPELFAKVVQDLFVALIKHAKHDIQGNQSFDLRRIGVNQQSRTSEFGAQEDVHKKYRDAFFEDMRAQAETSSRDYTVRTGSSQNGRPVDKSSLATSQDISGQFPRQQPDPHNQPNGSSPSAQPQPSPNSQSSGSWHSIQPGDIDWPSGQPDGWPAQPEPTFADDPVMPPPVMPQAAAPSTDQQEKQQQGFQNLQMQMQHMNQLRQEPQNKSDAQMSFSNALVQIVGALDRELEIVAKAGADAFAQKDLSRADAALKFSGRLTEFRRMAQEFLEYYKRK